MYYVLLAAGVIMSVIGARYAVLKKEHPDRHRVLFGRSENTENVVRIFSTLFFPGGYILMLFSHGTQGRWLMINGVTVLIFHFLISPMLVGLIMGKRRKDL